MTFTLCELYLNKVVIRREKKIREDEDTDTNTEGRPCEDTGRSQPPTSQGKMSQKKTTLLTPRSQTSSLQNYH